MSLQDSYSLDGHEKGKGSPTKHELAHIVLCVLIVYICQ
jgi:hypothetical protein